jgi:hypothetical protein
MAIIDLNRVCISATPINTAINAMIEAAAMPEPNKRQYLGASSIGSECMRRIQFDWMVDSVTVPAATSTASSRARSRPTCRCRRPPSTNW